MEKTSRRTNSIIAALALAAVAATSACGSAGETVEQTPPAVETPATGQAGALNEDAAPESSEGEQGSTAADLVTVAYEDAIKSVYLLDRTQVEAAAGQALDAGTIEAVAQSLARSELWQRDSRTAPYAQLIADAFARETGSTEGALQAALHDSGGRLKIFVLHNGHRDIAHIETDHDD